MAITEIVKGDGSKAPRRVGVRLGWFVGIWAMSTGGFFVLASLLHFLIPK